MNTVLQWPVSIWKELSFLLSWRFWYDSTRAMPMLAYNSLAQLKRIEWSALALTFLVILLSAFNLLAIPLPTLELAASLAYAWSVWLLRKDDVLGWYVGNIGVLLFIYIFVDAKLYGEVIIMIYYLITDMIGINNWLTGTQNDPPPHRYLPAWQFAVILLAMIPATWALTHFLIAIRGAAPLADATTTVLSAVANVMLAKNLVRSWYLWVAADVIYVPLYLSRGLPILALLYVILLGLAVSGLFHARKMAAEVGHETTT